MMTTAAAIESRTYRAFGAVTESSLAVRSAPPRFLPTPPLAASTELFDLLTAIARAGVLEVLVALAHGPKTVGQLAEDLQLSLSYVSARLTILLEHRLVSFQADKRLRFYEVTGRVRMETNGSSQGVTLCTGDGRGCITIQMRESLRV